MILSGQTIRARRLLHPLVERGVLRGRSFGLSACGYDVRVEFGGPALLVLEPGDFLLASTVESFDMPPDVVGFVHDKSSWARLGVAVQNTVIEPGWRGFLTLELTNHSREAVVLERGDPIAQVVFQLLDEPAEHPYDGKYQDQERGPQPARHE